LAAGARHLFQTWQLPQQLEAAGLLRRRHTRRASDRLVDAVVAYGTPEAIAARMKGTPRRRCRHVPLQILTKDENLVSALAELAGPLGCIRVTDQRGT